MPSRATPRPPHPARGVILMAVAMLIMPMVDGLAKHLSARYSPLFLGWARYVVASLVVLPIAAAVHGPRLFPADRLWFHVLRTVFLVAAMTLDFMAIARLPLATAISAFLIAPIAAVVLSVFVLKERLTPRKVVALALGTIGSLIILQPGGSRDPGLFLAFGAGVLFALYLLATRHASQTSDPVRTLAFQCAVGTVLLTPQAILAWRPPEWRDAALFLALGGISALSHMMSITAFRLAGASTLSPLVYLELVGAAVTGYVAFGEIPSWSTIIGAAFIVGAGFVLLRTKSQANE